MSASARPGVSVPRAEDVPILTGTGRYADDIAAPLHAAFVRSVEPHARIRSIDASAALRTPGCVAVFTGPELAAALGDVQPPGTAAPTFPALAHDRVRHVGDPLAVIVAESRYAAEDACEMVAVDYEPLPAVATPAHARDVARPPLFEDLGTNVLLTDAGVFGDPAAAFASADRVVRRVYRGARVSPAPLETRGGVATYDGAVLHYAVGTQSTHALRSNLATALGLAPEAVRVTVPDIGGAFGQKSAATCREDIAVCFAAIRLGRPVKFVEDRGENLVAASQAREDTLELAAAVRDDGTILAFDLSIVHDQGAYPLVPARFGRFGSAMRTMLPGPYRIADVRWRLEVVATTKASYGAYRGPWAPEALAREALLDEIARELELDAVELRRRNLIGAAEQPHQLATGPTVSDVDPHASLERAVTAVDYAGFREHQARLRAQGRLVGIGFSCFIEAAPGQPDFYTTNGWPAFPEPAAARLDPDGGLTVFTPQAPSGQGHATTLAQVAAAAFGLPLESVRMRFADTAVTPANVFGTAGSRAATMATGAVSGAVADVREQTRRLAGELLEISPEDLEIVDGFVRPRGAPHRSISLSEVAAAADRPLHADVVFEHAADGGGWSGGTHVCIAEVDPELGGVRLLRYVVVEDCGAMINPAIVDGQIRGGVAQGIGVALLEHAAYDDEDGSFLTGTLMDYLLPCAVDVPAIEIVHLGPGPAHPGDFRGVGEGGTVAAPPAVVNATADAIGGGHFEVLPLTPERVLAHLTDWTVDVPARAQYRRVR
jgi:carbon-monoxide dehydrogenase large subunit